MKFKSTVIGLLVATEVTLLALTAMVAKKIHDDNEDDESFDFDVEDNGFGTDSSSASEFGHTSNEFDNNHGLLGNSDFSGFGGFGGFGGLFGNRGFSGFGGGFGNSGFGSGFGGGFGH